MTVRSTGEANCSQWFQQKVDIQICSTSCRSSGHWTPAYSPPGLRTSVQGDTLCQTSKCYREFIGHDIEQIESMERERWSESWPTYVEESCTA